MSIELCCRSHYSFLRGASSPEALVKRAVELGMTALGLADIDGLYAASAFYKLCKEAKIQPIIGAAFDGVILLCENMTGYSTLSKMLTRREWLEPEGLICLAPTERALYEQRDRFGHDQLFALLIDHLEEGDQKRCRRLANLGYRSVRSNRPHYARQEDGELYDILCCVKQRVPIDQVTRPSNHERYLKPIDDPIAREIAERCQIDLDFSSYRFPTFPVPPGESTHTYLRKLCEKKQKSAELDQELKLIKRLDLSGYFLVVWDICEFARSKGIPVQGRGSAANSLVAYLLGITPVDPIKHKLFLGRFIHEGMTTLPDIDLDFAASRDSGLPDREDVIQYVYQKYGQEHVAMVCTYITFQKKLARREVNLALGADHPRFEEFVQRLIDTPRHTSIHVGGMLISSKPISELVPLQPARMEGRIVCQWDKNGVEDAGLIKVDILGLGMLAVLRDAGIDHIPDDDPATYEMIAQADTIGVFQIESPAQRQSLPRTQPKNLPELAIQIALIRPGPLQGNMVNPYIRRKQGKEPITCSHPALEETLGVVLFQEQVLQVATSHGMTPAQAAHFRRTMEPGLLPAAIYEQLKGFASYGFCKSHALSFAHIAYQSAYLKRHHPAEYTAALLNNQPMGLYPPDTLIEDAKRHGVTILPPHINHSRARSTIENGALRLGLELITDSAKTIEAHQPYSSLQQLAQQIGPRCMERLILAGAVGQERRETLWKLWTNTTTSPQLPIQTDWEKLQQEYQAMGFSRTHHPMAYLRESLSQQGFTPFNALHKHVRTAGLLICRQRPPTAKGFTFLTLEDETGLIQAIVPPDLPIPDAPILAVLGTYQGKNTVKARSVLIIK